MRVYAIIFSEIMEIKRDLYLNKLIRSMHNGMIKVAPLSFSEFFSVFEGSPEDEMEEYMTFGGLPKIVAMQTDEEKMKYLQTLFRKTILPIYWIDTKSRTRRNWKNLSISFHLQSEVSPIQTNW